MDEKRRPFWRTTSIMRLELEPAARPESWLPRTLQGAMRRCSVSNVTSIPKALELARLSVADRLDLMDEIWASLAPETGALPLPEWHVAEVRRRLAAAAADGIRGRTADEVFAELKRRL